jgi:hypothetical protein
VASRVVFSSIELVTIFLGCVITQDDSGWLATIVAQVWLQAKPGHMRFVVDKVALRQFFCQVVWFPLWVLIWQTAPYSVIILYWHCLVSILIALLNNKSTHASTLVELVAYNVRETAGSCDTLIINNVTVWILHACFWYIQVSTGMINWFMWNINSLHFR